MDEIKHGPHGAAEYHEPALGVILAEAMGYLTAGAWWLALFPGAVLALSVMLFAHGGELARSVLDPRSMQE